MKKSLFCLIVAALLLLPVLLTSCGDDMTAEDIANANFQKADTALTLSLWLPVSPTVDSDGDGVNDKLDNRFDERLQAVEAKINDYLRSNNYCTKIEIVAVLEDQYYGQLTDKFASIKEIEETDGKAHFIADKYVNHAVKNEETQVFEMAYPELLDQQLDIFFVGGYDNYINYINSGDTQALNEFFTEGQVFNDLLKKIRSIYFEAMKVDKSYYAIPNNHLYAENGQYILVNKELYDNFSGSKWDGKYTLADFKEYIQLIGEAAIENVVPYCGSVSDIPGIVFLDEENMIVAKVDEAQTINGKVTFYPDQFLMNMDYYKSFLKFYYGLDSLGYVSEALEGEQVAAVQLYRGNLIDFANKDDYYIIETIPPYADSETLYSSMFAISTHSANYERAMQILYLLQDNTEIRTLLQYGIVEEDYDLGSVNGETVIYTKNSGYHMDLLYTGNCYRTYPASGVPMSYWDAVQESNLETEIFPFLNYQQALKYGKFNETTMAKYNELVDQYRDYNAKLKEAIDNLDSKVYELWQGKASALDAFNNSANAAYNTAKDNYDAAKAIYDSASSTVEEKQNALAAMNEYATEMEIQSRNINRCEYARTLKGSVPSGIYDLVDQCKAMYDSVN